MEILVYAFQFKINFGGGSKQVYNSKLTDEAYALM